MQVRRQFETRGMQRQDTARVFDEAQHKDNENCFTYEEEKERWW
jgi:hypothetical protein